MVKQKKDKKEIKKKKCIYCNNDAIFNEKSLPQHLSSSHPRMANWPLIKSCRLGHLASYTVPNDRALTTKEETKIVKYRLEILDANINISQLLKAPLELLKRQLEAQAMAEKEQNESMVKKEGK